MGVSLDVLGVLFGVALAAGFIDTLAGGGGLITIPALMVSGLPPLTALGTNKLQGCMGTATATLIMLRKGRIVWPQVRWLMLTAFAGAVLGTLAVQWIDTAALRWVIPLVLLFIAVYFLLAPQPVYDPLREPKLSARVYRSTVVPAIGAYDGMFGPGTGSFFALSGVACRGLDLISATAAAKALNFSTNIASLLVFALAGKVAWVIGGAMIAGQILGAVLGSRCLLSIDPRHLRLIVVAVSCIMLTKYLLNLNDG